jgi:hypothetical protein
MTFICGRCGGESIPGMFCRCFSTEEIGNIHQMLDLEHTAAKKAREAAVVQQATPLHNMAPASWDLVMADISKRDKFGLAKYGTRLQPHNGRDALIDVYQELLDAVVYMRSVIYERDGK